MRWEESRWKQKRETQDTECKVRVVQRRQHHGASPAEKLVSAEDRRQRYGNGCLAASLADCKQDLGKAYSLW